MTRRPSTRHEARERALQLLFQWDIHAQGGAWEEDFWEQFPMEEDAKAFATGLVAGVRRRLPELDIVLGRYATNWKVSRMPIVDRNILRQGIFELRWTSGVPPKVAINEALEVAKKFSTHESSRFINGILDRIHKEQAPAS